MKAAVIGDRAANKYFGSLSVIGRMINICGEEYWVKGVLKIFSTV